jgi:putative transposase
MVFIHLGSRQIWISPCIENPTSDRTSQQRRNFQMHIDQSDLKCMILMRDQDRKYTDSFDNVFKSSMCEIKLTPIRSPNLQAHVERVTQTIKHEVLGAFCVVNNLKLNHLLQVTQDWYDHCRRHSSREHLPPILNKVATALIKRSKN